MLRIAIIISLSLLVFYSNINGISIYILDEAKNATCAREMYERGDLVVPTYNGDLRTEKPPLHYYFMMAAYAVSGTTPFTARFFSAFMGVFTVLIVYFFTKHYRNERSAFYASLIMLASLMAGIQFHLSVPDPYLIAFMMLGTLFLYRAWQREHAGYMIAGYTCLGLAFLAKGPIAVMLPAFGILLFFLFRKEFNWPNVKKLAPWWGLLIILIVTFPWYYLVGLKTDGEWLREFFFKQNVERFTSTMEGHGGFPFSAIVILFAALLPFSVFIPQAVIELWKARKYDHFTFFALSCGTAIVLFFSFSRTILPSYLSPAIPFFAIVLGSYLNRIPERIKQPKNIATALYALVFLTMILPLAAYFGLEQDKGLNHLSHLAFYLLLLPIGAIVALVLYKKNKVERTIYVLAGSFIATFVIIMYVVLPPIDRTNPVYHSRKILEAYAPKIYYYERMNAAYAFHYGKVIPRIPSETVLDSLLRADPEALIISRKDKLGDLLQNKPAVEVFRRKDLFDLHTTIIFKGRPKEGQGLVSDK
ncbi:ArnT family glycosyltransferase [Roseivirga sp. BDSF3-8]|uniref:ArnT family glycosyltransferase n=1 Tax=Roseivirga sp. BDSF3-8 TaxID=3241598 RepID=UPI0035326F86